MIFRVERWAKVFAGSKLRKTRKTSRTFLSLLHEVLRDSISIFNQFEIPWRGFKISFAGESKTIDSYQRNFAAGVQERYSRILKFAFVIESLGMWKSTFHFSVGMMSTEGVIQGVWRINSPLGKPYIIEVVKVRNDICPEFLSKWIFKYLYKLWLPGNYNKIQKYFPKVIHESSLKKIRKNKIFSILCLIDRLKDTKSKIGWNVTNRCFNGLRMC